MTSNDTFCGRGTDGEGGGKDRTPQGLKPFLGAKPVYVSLPRYVVNRKKAEAKIAGLGWGQTPVGPFACLGSGKGAGPSSVGGAGVEAAESGHRPGERGEVTGAGRGKQEIVKEAGGLQCVTTYGGGCPRDGTGAQRNPRGTTQPEWWAARWANRAKLRSHRRIPNGKEVNK